MQQLIQKIFRPGFAWLAEKFGSEPEKEIVFKSLSSLYKAILTKKSHRGLMIELDENKEKFIIFSDQHKGNRNRGDDFASNEENYLAALKYYHAEGFSLINLGDAEELWKYTPEEIVSKNTAALQAEAAFHQQNKYYRTFGNHDILWKNKKDVSTWLQKDFILPLRIYEGLVLRTTINSHKQKKHLNILLTHGHQGDTMSDNNSMSTWLVAHLWAPVQRYLQININTPAKDYHLRDKHNKMMHEWSSNNTNLLLITGHTHKPVFASGKFTADPEHKIETNLLPEEMKPCYFNTGCCCYYDGDITGIEINSGQINLIKWHKENSLPKRQPLEEMSLAGLYEAINK